MSDELLLTDEEVGRIWSGFTKDYGTLTRPTLTKLFLAQLARAKQQGWRSEKEVKELIQDEHNQHIGEAEYEQKRLDRPELREKASQLKSMIKSITTLASDKDKWAEMFDIIDQILALIPDIEELKRNWNAIYEDAKIFAVEEAKKQERERIEAEGFYVVAGEEHGFREDMMVIPITRWQAVKDS